MEQALLTNAQDHALQVDMELVLQTNAQDLVQLALSQPLDLQRAPSVQLEGLVFCQDSLLSLQLVQEH